MNKEARLWSKECQERQTLPTLSVGSIGLRVKHIQFILCSVIYYLLDQVT